MKSPKLTSNERQYYIDWLRIGLILSVFFFHIGMIFNSWNWHIKNELQYGEGSSLWYVMIFLSSWRMPLLIFISGAGTFFALGRRSSLQYVAERFKRLFVPLLFGIMVLVPVQVYLEKSGEYHSLAAFYPHFFDGIYPQGNFSWHHLWFIAYLLFISLVFSLLIPFFKSSVYNTSAGFLCKAVDKPLGANLFLIPMLLSQILLRPYFPEDTHALLNDWAALSYFFIFFLSGYIIISRRQMISSIMQQRHVFLLQAIISAASLFIIPKHIAEAETAFWAWEILRIILAWSCGMAVLAYARKYLNISNKFRKTANEAIYPFYLLHQPFIVTYAYLIVDLSISVLAKAALISTAAFLSTIALYWFVIKRFWFTRLIFGMKTQDGLRFMPKKDKLPLKPIHLFQGKK